MGSGRASWLAICVLAMGALATSAQEFREGWETAPLTELTPSSDTFISADEGFWAVNDTISQFPDCGRTRNQAQIRVENGSRVLRLLSNRSFTNCTDDIWVLLSESGSFNQGFAVPLIEGTTISFNERGELEDPQLHDGGVNCLIPPCFDNISLVLTDNNNNILAYVMQRYPGAVENRPNTHYGDTYREIFLDPQAGTYQRNLFDDFSRIRTFDPDGATIKAVEFRVDEHGWGIIDNLVIDSNAAELPVHRFWSPITNGHFYTTSEAERRKILNIYSYAWVYEGIAFRALSEDADPDASPVDRFWSPITGCHFYTIDPAERDLLLERFAGIWIPEGAVFYAYAEGSQPGDTVPVYRFWSPVAGCHFYTADEAERDLLVRNFPAVWTLEGIAWYALRP